MTRCQVQAPSLKASNSSCVFEAHLWRNRCIKCKQPKNGHKLIEDDIKRLESVLSSLAKKSAGTESKSDHVYAWIPPECPRERVEEFFSCFPEYMIPKHKSCGIHCRIGQIFKQIPLSDLSELEGKFVDKACAGERRSLMKTIVNKKIKFGLIKEWEQSMPQQCPKCLQLLKEMELVVISNEIPFHPACFTCCICKEPLVDLIHCAESNGEVYCVRHYSENFKKRCYACDELIFATRLAQWKDTFYHFDHLRCFECDKKVTSGGAFENEGQLYCTECYQKIISAECELCGKKVSLVRRHVMIEGKCWHAECFKCDQCGEVLESFEKHDDKFLCKKCYLATLAPKCAECEIPFVEEGKVIKYEGKMYHIPCFRCEDCKESFNEGPFVPHGDLVFCKCCYRRHFGIHCFECQFPITDEPGLVFKKNPYHSGCFTCCKCSGKLGKNPLKLVDEKRYCLECYGEMFCKRCYSCEKPIVLRGKEVLHSYEDFHWHTSCLVCCICEDFLENRLFNIQGNTLVCKECTEKPIEPEKAVIPAEEVPQEEKEATPESGDKEEPVEIEVEKAPKEEVKKGAKKKHK